MIQDIKPGYQSTIPSLIILGQSIVYAEVVAKQTGPNRRNNRFSAPSDECLRLKALLHDAIVKPSLFFVLIVNTVHKRFRD